jgi:type II secretory pathway pseudopilin PulG
MSSPLHFDSDSSSPEAGFMLVFVILLTSLILIALAVAAPIMARQLRRDKELESAQRAQQYVRAIRLYYRKLKTYPATVDALENTNDIRFLRKQYIDPLTGKNDWRLIHVGEQKTTVKGFFGQPLGGLDTTGAGASLGSASTLGSGFGGAASPTTGSTTVTSTSPLSAGLGGASIGGGGATPAAGSSLTSPGGTGTDSGSTTSVGPIMGVGTSKTGTSIMNPNAQTTYETWEFLYDPKIELLYAKSSLFGGQIASQSASSVGSDAASGQSNSGSSNTSTPTSPPSNNSPFSSH